MPDISFYILPSNSEQGRFNFACKLAEKAYRAESKVYILTDSNNQSRKLDDLLWTFRAGSFIPHQIHSTSATNTELSVLIGTNNVPKDWQQTIINVSTHCPNNIEQSERVLEILDNDEMIKQSGRLRYRQYQKSGFTINTHKI